MSSSSYLELLKLKQAKLLKVVDLFESGAGKRSEFLYQICCASDNASFNHSKNAVLRLSFIRNVKLECPNKKLIKSKDLQCSSQQFHLSVEKPFKCRDCKYATSREQSIKEHQVRMHWKSTDCNKKVFVCEFDGCTFRTTFNSRAVEHRRRHLKIRPFKCHHPDCGRSFVSRYCLRRHKMVHVEKKRFRCMQNNCKFATKYRTSLRVHQATHSSVRAFRCPYKNCTYAAKQRSALRSHLRIHSEAKPYKCPFNGCSFATKYMNSVRGHTSRHKNAKQFKKQVDYMA